MPEEFIKGRNRHQFNVVFHSSAREREEFRKCVGSGDDGRAGIERVSLFAVNIRASTGLIAFFKQSYFMAGRLKANGGCKATEAAADNGN